MTDEQKEKKAAAKTKRDEAKAAKAQAKAAKAQAKAAKAQAKAAKAQAKRDAAKTGVKAGAQPDHSTKHKIRVRTQGGHKLYLPAIEFWAPGKETKLEVTDAQIEHLKLDGRIMIDDQIDAFNLELEGIKDRKAVGTRLTAPERTEIPEGLPVNYPGGKRMPNVKLPEGAKTAEELVSEEKKLLEKSKRERRARDKRA